MRICFVCTLSIEWYFIDIGIARAHAHTDTLKYYVIFSIKNVLEGNEMRQYLCKHFEMFP